METLVNNYFFEEAPLSSDFNKSDNDCHSLISTGSSNESDDCRKCEDCTSNSTGKDSGVECVLDLISVDPILKKKLVETVEFYFSDENLAKDAFLRKHIRRNKECYVSLKLISSFRKIKALTKHWEIVADSIKNGSDQLEINENCTKVRRIKPSNFELSQEHRTLIAYGFRDEEPNKDELIALFSSCGKVDSVEILKTTDEKPDWFTLLSSKVVKEINNKCLAIVEFKESSSVKKAKEELSGNRDGNWRKTLKVIAMDEISNIKTTNRNPSKKYLKNIETGSSEGEIVEDKKQNKKKLKKVKSLENKVEYYDSCYNSGSETDIRSNLRSRNRSSTNSWSIRKNSAKDISNSEFKLFQRQKSKSISAVESHNYSRKSISLTSNIIRMPLGPDGSKGFKNLTKLRSNSEPIPVCYL